MLIKINKEIKTIFIYIYFRYILLGLRLETLIVFRNKITAAFLSVLIIEFHK
jgi:hypothetical protein